MICQEKIEFTGLYNLQLESAGRLFLLMDHHAVVSTLGLRWRKNVKRQQFLAGKRACRMGHAAGTGMQVACLHRNPLAVDMHFSNHEVTGSQFPLRSVLLF